MRALIPSGDCRAPPVWRVLELLIINTLDNNRGELTDEESYRCGETDVLFDVGHLQLTVPDLHRDKRVDFHHLFGNLHVWHWHQYLTNQMTEMKHPATPQKVSEPCVDAHLSNLRCHDDFRRRSKGLDQLDDVTLWPVAFRKSRDQYQALL